MIWDYLSQFWNSIAEVVVTSGTYTVEWFQSLGNAVAGAVGSMFDGIFHIILDFMTAFGFYISIFFNFFKSLIRPFDYFFSYISSGISSIFSPVTYNPDLNWVIPENILSIFQAIPYWSNFTYAIGGIVLFLVGFKIFNLISKI